MTGPWDGLGGLSPTDEKVVRRSRGFCEGERAVGEGDVEEAGPTELADADQVVDIPGNLSVGARVLRVRTVAWYIHPWLDGVEQEWRRVEVERRVHCWWHRRYGPQRRLPDARNIIECGR